LIKPHYPNRAIKKLIKKKVEKRKEADKNKRNEVTQKPWLGYWVG